MHLEMSMTGDFLSFVLLSSVMTIALDGQTFSQREQPIHFDMSRLNLPLMNQSFSSLFSSVNGFLKRFFIASDTNSILLTFLHTILFRSQQVRLQSLFFLSPFHLGLQLYPCSPCMGQFQPLLQERLLDSVPLECEQQLVC